MQNQNHPAYQNSDDGGASTEGRDLTNPEGTRPNNVGTVEAGVKSPLDELPFPAVTSGVAHSITSLVIYARRQKVQYAVFIALVVMSFACGITILLSL